MRYQKKWEKLEGCDCIRCRDEEIKMEKRNHYQDHEIQWEKKDGCDCFKCREVNINVVCKEDKEDKHDQKWDCQDKKKVGGDKCVGPKDAFEFQYDTSFLDEEIKERKIPVLQVIFSKVCAGDRVWFNGLVGFDNDDEEFVTLRLSIVRTTSSGLSHTIYRQTFEIDEEFHDDLTQVAFSHVEFEQNDTRDVTYTVNVERVSNSGEVFFFGQNTLTALRIS